MNLRRFIYADVNLIESLFSQVYGDIENISSQTEQKNSKKMNAEIQLPSILHGFLPGNFTGEIERDRGRSVAIQKKFSIESKIELLAEAAIGRENEPIASSPINHNRLVLGKTMVCAEKDFSRYAIEILRTYGCDSVEELLKGSHSIENFKSVWEEIKNQVIKKQETITPFLIASPMRALCMLGPNNAEDVIEKIISINTKKPVVIPFSLRKILVSESDLAGLSYVAHASSICVLGHMNKANKHVYTLKPLAMWTIMSCTPVQREELLKMMPPYYGEYPKG